MRSRSRAEMNEVFQRAGKQAELGYEGVGVSTGQKLKGLFSFSPPALPALVDTKGGCLVL